MYLYCNGNKYDGLWKEDKKHGQGKYFYESLNESYIGEWKVY